MVNWFTFLENQRMQTMRSATNRKQHGQGPLAAGQQPATKDAKQCKEKIACFSIRHRGGLRQLSDPAAHQRHFCGPAAGVNNGRSGRKSHANLAKK
jgi:hypothetical protein